MDQTVRDPTSQNLAGLFAVSIAAHAWAWFLLGALPPLSMLIERRPPTEVEIVAEPPPPAPEPEPEPETPEPEPPPPEPEPEPVRQRREPTPVAQNPDPAPEPEAPPPAVEEQIEEFSGVTLTNETGESWTAALGNGQEMTGAIGGPTGAVTGRRREGAATGAVGGTGGGGAPDGVPFVSARDLGRPPSPPGNDELVEALRRNYPERLRSLGVEGNAVVIVRINPDGTIGRVSVRQSTDPDFGAACSRVLRQTGRWTPPLDRDGRAVSTDVRFSCDFLLSL